MDGAGPGSRWLSTATSGKVGLSSGRNEMQFAVSFNKTVSHALCELTHTLCLSEWTPLTKKQVTERVKPAGRCHVQIVNASPPGAASDPAVLLIPLSRAPPQIPISQNLLPQDHLNLYHNNPSKSEDACWAEHDRFIFRTLRQRPIIISNDLCLPLLRPFNLTSDPSAGQDFAQHDYNSASSISTSPLDGNTNVQSRLTDRREHGASQRKHAGARS